MYHAGGSVGHFGQVGQSLIVFILTGTQMRSRIYKGIFYG